MGHPENKLSDLVGLVKSWVPWRSDPVNVSRDFWMPDKSCRVCYECDSQFTFINRRHHCRRCGRVFCSKCTANFIPAHSSNPTTAWEDCEKIRVCNYCFKQWEKGQSTEQNENHATSPSLSPSPSATSLASTMSRYTCHSTTSNMDSMPCFAISRHHNLYGSGLSIGEQDNLPRNGLNCGTALMNSSSSYYALCSDDEDEYEDYHYGIYRSDSESRDTYRADDCYGVVNNDDIDHIGVTQGVHLDEDCISKNGSSAIFDTRHPGDNEESSEDSDEHEKDYESNYPAYGMQSTDNELVDFENNGLLWLPPEPEDEEDEKEALLFDDEDDCCTSGEWGYLRSTLDCGEYYMRDRSSEEHRKTVKNVVEGHFRALVGELLQVENLPVGDEYSDGWLDIITHLSWEAAALLKPDTSKSGDMDLGRFVKVKYVASGHRNESSVVKGIICKKNVAHRRMARKMQKPHFFILGGALEYQRVANHLSSIDTLLQQELDHLKMAVAKINAHHPNVLLVEKSVSRYAQEYLLAKNITLVLNIKRSLVERIACCTGAQVIPSVDHVVSPKLGYCDTFHVETFLEEHDSDGQGGKKLTKTLMFFEGCPKPLGCTILLKGASTNELKKVKHVMHYATFAAYHLALENCFLADEGASVPNLPSKSPVSASLSNNPSKLGRSISAIPGFSSPTSLNSTDPMTSMEIFQSLKDDIPDRESPIFKLDYSEPTLDSLKSDTFSNYSGIVEALSQYGESSHNNNHSFDENSHSLIDLASLKPESTDSNVVTKFSKEEFPSTPSDHQNILVSLSIRCVWKGIVCDRAHLLRIKYYGSFDKPLGRFLRDHLFDQNYRCRSCGMPSEAHIHCFAHPQGSLTISAKKLPEFFLPGESEGKIWMWHRCLKCPRTNGFLPTSRRVIMSDAAWGLSFGKFLELSFSNHEAGSRVACCGHFLHRDCLRFYGFGRTVACFHYATINVLSVHLPPPKLEFHHNLDWIQNEASEVHYRAEILFFEVCNALPQILKKEAGKELKEVEMNTHELSHYIQGLEEIIKIEKEDFEVHFKQVLSGETRVGLGQPEVDILEINKLHMHILFLSYLWVQRLSFAATLRNINSLDSLSNGILKVEDTKLDSEEKLVESDQATTQCKAFGDRASDFLLSDMKPEIDLYEGGNSSQISQSNQMEKEKNIDPGGPEDEIFLSPVNFDSLDIGSNMRMAVSEGECPNTHNLSDTLDAAWTGDTHPNGATITSEESDYSQANSAILESVAGNSDSEKFASVNTVGIEATHLYSALLLKRVDNDETCTSFMLTPSMYNTKTSVFNARKPEIAGYDPAFIKSFGELEKLGHLRHLMHIGVNDTVIPVYDDEPSSVIAYTLYMPEFHALLSEPDRVIDAGNTAGSSPLRDFAYLAALNSSDDTVSDVHRSLSSNEESIPSMSGSQGIQSEELFSYAKRLHARVSFLNEGPMGQTKYVTTCYFAKQFEALRRKFCPSELDYVRSLSRCKKWRAQGGKSNVFFAKTLDERFIIKQVTKTELESFIQFAPAYFRYLSESTHRSCPTCLAKILGIYQVSKHLKGGKEIKMDVLVMENLLFRRNVRRLYDLKGSCRSRYNSDTSGNNSVLLDENLIEAMPTSPIFVGSKAKRLLERAVWNDTSFLASIDVMDYSLLVGLDEEKHELILGIIDFVRQYTWDKHLETWVKISGILGGPKNTSPTVISPDQYKKRFRKAMTDYFLMVPEEWPLSTASPTDDSHPDFCDDNSWDW